MRADFPYAAILGSNARRACTYGSPPTSRWRRASRRPPWKGPICTTSRSAGRGGPAAAPVPSARRFSAERRAEAFEAFGDRNTVDASRARQCGTESAGSPENRFGLRVADDVEAVFRPIVNSASMRRVAAALPRDPRSAHTDGSSTAGANHRCDWSWVDSRRSRALGEKEDLRPGAAKFARAGHRARLSFRRGSSKFSIAPRAGT